MHGGYMHSKLQILKYEGLESTRPTAPPAETLFGTELRRFLRALGLDEKLVKSLDNYNFSETSRYGFIHSITQASLPAVARDARA
ncbi:uncharacterized protein ColSpa_03976 [Colletotrichum spaethianum]|uniref:Uncharacterized protein n=1 Tax=Colletotrichum spaethianum TaxID=700344 RepID=A0AA37LD52_9PEZI|nr:uncharacterized protein ColSpa_03976 [Colletotrichum spaethianum]GKT43795.1 hypothetical protein ColSpa_03976 [Colletotrichum spaethianum]